VVTKIRFESGDQVREGEVLLELETSVETAQLRTAQAQRKLAQQTVVRTRSLTASGGVPKAQLDADEAQLAAASAQVAGLEAQISRKVVRAPFAGKLGIRAVNLGQYLSPGTTITTLESLDAVFVDFALPQQVLPRLTPGMPVRITIEGAKGLSAEGSIAAVDPRIDETTRTIQVRASVPNRQQKLRPGMFANVQVVLPGETRVIAVPTSAIVHAPYGDSVFVVEHKPAEAAGAQGTKPSQDPSSPKTKPSQQASSEDEASAGADTVQVATQRFVRLGEQRGDFVSIIEGLEPGREVVSAGAFKLKNGARVQVNNEVKPEPELAPRPENR
jgi:membrane fusion protein (multidrug efflux system)